MALWGRSAYRQKTVTSRLTKHRHTSPLNLLNFFIFFSLHLCALFLATAVHYACFACFVLFRHAILLLFYLLARGRASQIQARQKVRCTGATFYRFLIISLSQRAWATKSQSKALSPSFLAHAILRSAQEAEVEQEAGKV
ncbi:AAR_G0029830.mRNA.1.CDS.1 [Saccharomyces cerevisiae]|nr:hypothetical protein WN66_03546 [Saccharomyces cerevisiae]CAI4558319.1 AAR_G0029830.mRNA.1.CDS.1 [Saccharomyces cerevisiae]CAI4561409.1 ABA_G0030090.mRNA.1.CDS.1 [Saccharomyces cerevisiae]CAI4940809.1 BAD_HP_G0023050.mRNA.1.CDS.1 [Saccharomyces cerevisiae]CAI4946827.1 BAD_HP_G0027240.mRNA.1.CDS.1 [Saccharomyces cerevisiae]